MSDEQPAETRHGLAHSTPVEWAVRALTALSAVALTVLLIATFTGVIMRYVFAAPLLGANEIIQLVSIVLVMLAMPAAAHQGDHVRVDVLDSRIGAIGRFAGDILSRAVAIYILYQLAIRGWAKLLDAAEFEDATNMLQIPIWPFYALLVLGTALFAIVLVLQLIDIVRGGIGRHE